MSKEHTYHDDLASSLGANNDHYDLDVDGHLDDFEAIFL